eukprot:9192860-Lingulodinium_polyedra.AAC.1
MVLYPAHVDLPILRAAKTLETLCARASRTADWAPRCVVGAIGHQRGPPVAPRRRRTRPRPWPR